MKTLLACCTLIVVGPLLGCATAPAPVAPAPAPAPILADVDAPPVSPAADAATPAPPARAAVPHALPEATAPHALSASARTLVERVRATQDNAGLPFLVIDKRQARLHVFDAHGRALGDAPVLLGMARGDDSVPGIGERPLAQILPHERTTPAGRFVAEKGHNAGGEDILWIDYDAAVSLHRVRGVDPKQRRLERLASRSAADNRISYGCVNVPQRFYDHTVMKAVSGTNAIVYVLPETRPLAAVFRWIGETAPQARAGASRAGPPSRPS